MSNQCAHGSLSRSCEICGRDEEIARLRDALAACRAEAGDDSYADVVSRLAAAEKERDEANEALAACQAQAGGEIERLKDELQFERLRGEKP